MHFWFTFDQLKCDISPDLVLLLLYERFPEVSVIVGHGFRVRSRVSVAIRDTSLHYIGLDKRLLCLGTISRSGTGVKSAGASKRDASCASSLMLVSKGVSRKFVLVGALASTIFSVINVVLETCSDSHRAVPPCYREALWKQHFTSRQN